MFKQEGVTDSLFYWSQESKPYHNPFLLGTDFGTLELGRTLDKVFFSFFSAKICLSLYLIMKNLKTFHLSRVNFC